MLFIMTTVWKTHLFLLLLIIFTESSVSTVSASQLQYDTKYFQTVLDHFSFTSKSTFKMKYLISTKYWKSGGPIFFYCGNEGAIELFANNTGFMWDIAPQFSAMLVFAEHRYYGTSLPFGKESYKTPRQFGYLTSEQALADYVDLLNYLKVSISGAQKSPVIAFGGSYGGMLAAWIRQKYPNVIAGSIAASAPVLLFVNITSCERYSEVTTQAYATSGSQACVSNVRASWKVISKYGASDAGRKTLQKVFGLCGPLNASGDALKGYLNEAYSSIAMGNYPYPATFLGPMPAWPVKQFCLPLKNASLSKNDLALMTQLSRGIQVYFNYTGKEKCLNLTKPNQESLDDNGWNYQSCMEMVMPMCANGVKDMFEPSVWNLTSVVANCQRLFGVRPRVNWIRSQFWGERLQAASNILFSNGKLDPWSSGGVLRQMAPTLPVVFIPSGAHHLDLRGANPRDPPDVRAAREKEKAFIKVWIKSWRAQD